MRLRAQSSLRIGALLLGTANAAFVAAPLHSTSSENKHCNDEVFQSALNEIRQKEYEQGRLLLKKLASINCSLRPAALVLIADSYYREGGSRCLENAGAEYERWLGLFPEHELAPLVMKKLAESRLRLIPGRDGGNHLELSHRTLLKLQDSYPQSSLDPRVQEYLLLTQELLADHQVKIARFYLDIRESAEAAKGRCVVILEKFPLFTGMDSALWFLARADETLAQTGEREDNIYGAIEAYKRIARDYADSEYRDKAIEKLKHFGIDVPDPDPEINAKLRERVTKARDITADIDGYLRGISRSGVLLNEEDDVKSDGLNRILKETISSASSRSQVLTSTRLSF